MILDLPPAPADAPVRGVPSVGAYVQAVKQALPGWVSQAVASTLDRLDDARQQARTAPERSVLGETWSTLQLQREAWTQRLVAALGKALDDDLAGTADAQGRAEAPLTLSLVSEDAVDEDIAVSRLVQVAESQADAALRELTARCSRIRGLASVEPDANPLRPAVVAEALRRMVAALGLPAEQRVALLRELGAAVGARLVPVYAAQVDLLLGWGVEPTQFKLRLNLGDRPFASPGAAGPTVHGSAHARADAAGGPDAPPERTPAPATLAADALRRLDMGRRTSDGEQPNDVMARLLSVLLSRVTLTDGSRDLIRRLEAPARRLAEHEPEVWGSPDHPLWQLLDRVVSAGSVHETFDAARPGAVGVALEQAVQQLESADPPIAADCRAALAAVDGAVTDLVVEQGDHVAPQAERLQQSLARDDIEARLREQIAQQVRGSGAPPALRQFLVGPWATALAHSAHTHGVDSPQMKTQVDLVDDMIATAIRAPGRPLAARDFTRFVTHARLALGDAEFSEQRIEAELADLGQVLRKPWGDQAAPAEPHAGRHGARTGSDGAGHDPGPETDIDHAFDDQTEVPPFAPTEPMDRLQDLGLHEALPTVPIDMVDTQVPDGHELARLRLQAWIDSLEPGTVCRMFMLGRWMNTQLVWRSQNRSMFVFSSRHGGCTHSLSRRTLDKLRAAGLAATIERGQFIAQALGELADAEVR